MHAMAPASASRCRSRSRFRATALALGLATAWGVLPWTALAQGSDALVGARTLGDPFYPTLGNAGYDMVAVDLAVAWTPPDDDHRAGSAAVTTALDLVATQALASLTLDLAPRSVVVDAVTVDGVPATHRQDDRDAKLVVDLPTVQPPGAAFRIVVGATAVPGPVPRIGEGQPWRQPGASLAESRIRLGRGLVADGEGGMFLAAQPNGAHTLFPVNDHPLDKATYRIALTAPPGMTGIATGVLGGTRVASDGSLTTTWVSRQPVASHVVSLGIGDRVLRSGPVEGGLTYRSAVPTEVDPVADPVLDALPGIVGWLEEAIGRPYPFDTFGLLAYAGRPTTAILEGQTLALVPATLFSPLADRCAVMGTLVHEAAHQWFGNDVSIARWDEKWLSEGHATLYEWRWLAENGCLDDEIRQDAGVDPPGGPVRPELSPVPAPSIDAADALAARARRAYAEAGAVRAVSGPPAVPVSPAAAYTAAIYDQGALALLALREEMGDRAFGRFQRMLVRRHSGGSVSTDDLIALASRVARRDLGPFLESWLRGPFVPPMPGHPDWVTHEPAASPRPSVGP